MEAFHHAVRFRMVRRGQNHFDSPGSRQLLKDGRGKLTSSVRCDGGGHAEIRDPSCYKRVDDRLGGNVGYGHGHGPAGEAVDGGEYVPVAVGEW